jgi:hypothetical protein
MNTITLKDQDIFICLAADIQMFVEKFGAEKTMELIDLAFDMDLVMNQDYKAQVGSEFAQEFLDQMRKQSQVEDAGQMMERLNGQ